MYSKSGTYSTSAATLSAITFAIALIGLNLGYSEYLSLPILGIAFALYLKIRTDGFGSIYIIAPQLIVGLLISIPMLWDLLKISDDTHSIFIQARELFFLLLIGMCRTDNQRLRRIAASALQIAAVATVILVIIQWVQIKSNVSIITVPRELMMLDYGNSIQSALEKSFDYLRPVALYSEPSVVASVLLPCLYLNLKVRNGFWVAWIMLGIILCGSILGIFGSIVVVLLTTNINRSPVFFLAVIVGALGTLLLSDRPMKILSGEDLSMQWRITMPLELLTSRLEALPFTAIPVDEILTIAAIYYQNASICDTWPLYTVMRLGYFGLAWIVFCVIVIPARIRLLFLFFCIVSGSPLYQDKALIMIITMWALSHAQVSSKEN